MSETPRTDALLASRTEPITAVKGFMRTLERELAITTAALRTIVRCVNAHDALVALAHAVQRDVFASTVTRDLARTALRDAGLEVAE